MQSHDASFSNDVSAIFSYLVTILQCKLASFTKNAGLGSFPVYSQQKGTRRHFFIVHLLRGIATVNCVVLDIRRIIDCYL